MLAIPARGYGYRTDIECAQRVGGQSWSLFETTAYDANYGRPARKTFPAAPGVMAQSVYLGYTLIVSSHMHNALGPQLRTLNGF
jgi:hypothetical protein